jgi:SAM-dependent methyltransferase
MTDHEHGRPHHGHGAVHLDEAHWSASVERTEREGELLLAFVTDTARWIAELRGADARPVRLVIDVGSGPGVGTCELARLFPDAQVLAVDSSPAMLDRVERRAAALGLGERVATRLAELPQGLEGVGGADLVWASMALHHVGDETDALRVMRGLLAAGGVLAIAERAEPTRVLPRDLDVGRPGLAGRLASAGEEWFASMRAGLPDSVASSDVPSMLTAAGLDVVATRVARVRLDPPLSGEARRFVLGQVQRAREHFVDFLDEDDLETLRVLGDEDDPRGVLHRPDVFVEASREITIASRPS